MTTFYDPPTDRAAIRRADKQAAAADNRAFAQMQAEQERLDRRDEAEQKRQDAKADAADKATAAKVKAQEKARRKTAAAARNVKRRAWLSANAELPFVGLVMVCSVAPALISQVAALKGAGVSGLIALLLATMLEGATWASTMLGRAAEKQGQPTSKYRTATWGFASLAAAVNFLHGIEGHPMWVAVVLAASSLLGVALWDLRSHRSHQKSKAEKQEKRDRYDHGRRQRQLHPQVAKLAESIVAARPFGTVTADDAFAEAWVMVHGTRHLGVTPDLRATAVTAASEFTAAHGAAGPDSDVHGIRARLYDGLYGAPVAAPVLGDVVSLRRPQTAKKPQVAAHPSPASDAPAKAPRPKPVPPRRTKGDSVPFSSVAKTAQSQETRERLAQ